MLITYASACLTSTLFDLLHDVRFLLNSTAAMDVPVLYAPTAFENACLTAPEVNFSPTNHNLLINDVCGLHSDYVYIWQFIASSRLIVALI